MVKTIHKVQEMQAKEAFLNPRLLVLQIPLPEAPLLAASCMLPEDRCVHLRNRTSVMCRTPTGERLESGAAKVTTVGEALVRWD